MDYDKKDEDVTVQGRETPSTGPGLEWASGGVSTWEGPEKGKSDRRMIMVDFDEWRTCKENLEKVMARIAQVRKYVKRNTNTKVEIKQNTALAYQECKRLEQFWITAESKSDTMFRPWNTEGRSLLHSQPGKQAKATGRPDGDMEETIKRMGEEIKALKAEVERLQEENTRIQGKWKTTNQKNEGEGKNWVTGEHVDAVKSYQDLAIFHRRALL